MSKLKALGKPTPQELIERDGYHCCRWCHYCVQENGTFKCVKCNLIPWTSVSIMHDLIEEGRVSEVIEEALHSCPDGEKEFRSNMVSAAYGVNERMSHKKQGEFESEFNTALEQYLDMRLKEVVVEAMEKVLSHYEEQEHEDQSEGAEIVDPFTHYCKDWW